MKIDLFDYLKKIKIQYKIAFLSTIVFGFLSQGMGIFNKYSYSDDIGGLFTLGATVTSGRWMLELVSKLEKLIFGDGTFSMPIINGIISFIYIGIAACLIVSLFEIENKTLCACLGGIMIVFPTITGLFGYMFTLPSYMLGMLLGVIGAYIVCKNNNWKIVFGIIFMTLCVGIYQAFIPFIIGIFVIWLIKYTTEHSNNIFDIIKQILKIIISIILFVGLYFIINSIFISYYNVELTTYQGINTMGKESISDYISRIVYAYGRFFILNEKSQYYMYYGNIKLIYYFIIIITIILMIILIIDIFKINKINSVILTLLFFSIPLASNFIFVMVNPEYVHALMVYGQIIPIILLIVLLDNDAVNNKYIRILSTIGTIVILILNVMYCRFDNQCYLKATFSQQEAISYFTTLITRIKSCEDYDDDLPVSFIFVDGKHIEDKTMYIMSELDYIRIMPYDNQFDYVNNYVWKIYMKRWCGYDPNIIDGSDLLDNIEVLNMSCYPDAGSIKVVDNRIVVRFQ